MVAARAKASAACVMMAQVLWKIPLIARDADIKQRSKRSKTVVRTEDVAVDAMTQYGVGGAARSFLSSLRTSKSNGQPRAW